MRVGDHHCHCTHETDECPYCRTKRICAEVIAEADTPAHTEIIMTHGRCRDCWFFSLAYECRRHAPVRTTAMHYDNTQRGWPIMRLNDGCGDFHDVATTRKYGHEQEHALTVGCRVFHEQTHQFGVVLSINAENETCSIKLDDTFENDNHGDCVSHIPCTQVIRATM